MAGEPAVQREAQVDQAKMQRVADQIVDQDSDAGYAESLLDEGDYRVGFEMVREETTTYEIEALVAEGKSKGIGNDSRA